ncbi:SusC/RagA family TonB-linked outer membrane protein [Flavobacterium sp. 7A]|uniref:SusC/RagA family TonB-linked outer membrane protein n=1 Tax=Flavobacterium sp. 7A TaxID=2940571 RepID=UPI0022260DB4|nr:SusC/RagA family TonB-linked outer membrane protein [Flavobacterium sp. 7A]MCW2117763.1 TonB-linked SusC/RagA family outer membrane protein [Flavobacterium sp. 7A]
MKLKFSRILVLILVLTTQFIIAQERIVSGVVSDDMGMPLPGVSILVKGTKSGAQTNFDGKYSIKASPKQVIIFSYIGMETKELTASSATLNAKLVSTAVQLEGAVVTAFGIKKQKRALAAGTSIVTGKELTEVNNTNVFESLSGKIAGVDISAPAQVGASSKVVIRGFNSLSSSSPLYIVDGTPINNNTSSSSETSATRTYDAGTGIGDVDPNNIESMTVLKGAAASALYGSRAANGVIIITTKSGKNNQKLTVEVSSSSDFSQVARVPHLQNEFGQGWNGKSWSNWTGSPNTASNENGSWGPAFNGEVRLHGTIIDNQQQIKPYVALENNLRDFFTIGHTFTNSVRLSGGSENSNFSINYTDVNSDGIIPTNADAYLRKTFGVNAGIKGKKLSVKTSINYVKKDQNAVNTGQGSASGQGNTLMQELLQIPRDISVVDQKDYINNPYATSSNFFTPYSSNPYFVVNENSTKIDGNRLYGNVNFNYQFNEKLSLSYQVGGDYGVEKLKSYGAIINFTPGSAQDNAATIPTVGGVTENTRENVQFDSNMILSYNTTINDDINITSFIGFNTNQRKNSLLQASITNLDIPEYYELSNSSVKPQVVQNNLFRKSFGAFGSVETAYKNRYFLTVTARNDWSSTLPQGNNSYFYSSAALSAIVLDAQDYFLKIRASYAEIGKDTDPYQTQTALISGNASLGFGNIFLPIGGVNGYEFSSNLGNKDLVPERTNEIEFGFETSLFNKRVFLDGSFYSRTTNDLLFKRPLPTSTGYATQTGNILDVRNQGVELLLNVVPVKTNDFKWDITTTFTKNVGEVLNIAGGVEKLNLASNYGVTFNAVKGQPLGVFSAKVPVVNEQGQYVVDPATGFYKITNDEQNIGNAQRKFVMGLKNVFTYKNIALAMGLDWKQGGKMYSYTKRLSNFVGNGIETTYNDRNTFIVPNSVNEVTNSDGAVTGYTENTKEVSIGEIANFYNTTNNPGIEQTHVIDKTFVRLRDVSLTYTLNSELVKRLGLSRASFSLYGKNLALWTPKDNPYVDPELSTFGTGLLSEQGEFGTNPSQRSYGASIKLTF